MRVAGRWASFDGNLPHCTLAFAGTRFSLIYYSQLSHRQLQPADRAYLEVELGFRLPPKEGGAPALRYATRDDRIARGLRAFALWQRCEEDSLDYLAAWRGSREDDPT